MAETEWFGRSQTCLGGTAPCSAEEAGVGDGEAGFCSFHAVVGMQHYRACHQPASSQVQVSAEAGSHNTSRCLDANPASLLQNKMPSSCPLIPGHRGVPSSGWHGADHYKAFLSLGLSCDTLAHRETKQGWQLILFALMV